MNQPLLTTILVTGVGDTVGQALLKAARQSALPCRLLGSDRNQFCARFQWVEASFVLPHCSREDEYLAGIRRICADEKVSLILPGSESELLVLSRHREALRAETGAIVVASPPEVLDVALDKFETCRFLESAGLNFPRYARSDDATGIEKLIQETGFPLIAKPCHGTGSRGVVKVHSRPELNIVLKSGMAMVLQECLEPEEEEYSVEVYTLGNGQPVGAICYRRKQLIAGDTCRARILSHPAAEAEALAVVQALQPAGPCNVQLRVTKRGPVTFEINPRFSGGVSMRAHFGYNEVEMAIRDLVRHEPVLQPQIHSGLVIRFWEEAYLDEGPAFVTLARVPEGTKVAPPGGPA